MNNNNIEEWRLIDGFDNYQVSSVGRIRNTITQRILKQRKNRYGYYCINLRKNSVVKLTKIHRLVAFAFCNNDNNYDVVDHIDRNKTNNNYLNLRWVSNSMNSRNATIRIDNTSGTKGVFFHEKQNRWCAQWYDNEGIKSKSFPIKKYGLEAKQKAIDHRRQMEAIHGYL